MKKTSTGIYLMGLRNPLIGKRTRNKKDQGFSFIAVLIILGILGATTVPKLLHMDTYPLNCAAAKIANDIRHAQELAMSTHDDKNVTFTLSGNFYTVETNQDGVFRTVALPSRVTITSATLTFTFNPLGEPKAGGNGSITISVAGESKTITVASHTGKVSIL
jgi:type II secretory pathway pseudopilin PulG